MYPKNKSNLGHVFLITKVKTLAKKLLAVRPEIVTRREKNTRMAIEKLFALNANAKRGTLWFTQVSVPP